MESMSLKIQELDKEISVFNTLLKEDVKKIEKLNREISHVKSMKDGMNCNLNYWTQRFENLGSELKNIHESYHNLPKGSKEEYIQCEVAKRKEELLEEKRKIESQLGLLKLNRSVQEEKLEELRSQAVIQQKKRVTLVSKLRKSIEETETAKTEAMIKLAKLRKIN